MVFAEALECVQNIDFLRLHLAAKERAGWVVYVGLEG